MVDDPILAAAVVELRAAEKSIGQSMRYLNYFRTDNLQLAMNYLGSVASAIEIDGKSRALALPLLTRRDAARLMGRTTSGPKLEGAKKARAVKLEKCRRTNAQGKQAAG